ncbi:MAG TPA: amidohydrolase family protein [Bryobacteraceae bacterium]|nr:amidohydrolase family protein [Bryobacteraceae bacterium]
MLSRSALAFLICSAALTAQNPLYPGIPPFLAFDAPVVALEHVRLIDGTGASAREDQTILIAAGKIRAAGPAAQVVIPENARRLDLTHQTVIPGLVGMHEHLFYPSGGGVAIYTEHAFSFPRLYLAAGVTTARTAGTLEPHTDLNIKKLIDDGRMPGPKLLITAGYLEGKGMFTPQMTEVDTPAEARRFVEYYAALGAHSFKAYMNISRAALGAAIQTAHEHHLTLTGHLCSVTFREAAALGIDNLEHGLIEDTDFVADKQPDVCPATQAQTFRQLDIAGDSVRQTIQTLVQHKVAITSTLAVFERNPIIQKRFLDVLAPGTALNYMTMRARGPAPTAELSLEIRKELAFEHAFVQAGGLLTAGADPTGNGSALAGYADQRNIEILVEGGFQPEQAIRIATLNGAEQLGLAASIGSIASGKQADLVVLDGNPVARIADIENVKLVFKDGVAYDPAKLIDSIRGHVGLH